MRDEIFSPAQTVVPWYKGTVGANCVRPRAFKERPYGEYMFAGVGVEGERREDMLRCGATRYALRARYVANATRYSPTAIDMFAFANVEGERNFRRGGYHPPAL